MRKDTNTKKIVLCGYGAPLKKIEHLLIDKSIDFPFRYFLDNFDISHLEKVNTLEEGIEKDEFILENIYGTSIYVKGRYGIHSFYVEEINTDIPWRLFEDDGSLTIEYFNGLTVLDKNTNYSEW